MFAKVLSATRTFCLVGAFAIFAASLDTATVGASTPTEPSGTAGSVWTGHQPGGLSLSSTQAEYTTYTNVRTSRTGRWVVFHSPASFLVPGDLNGEPDVFLHDLNNDVITLVSRATDGNPAGGDSSFPDISANGRWVVYHSEASDLVAGDDNDTWDVFLWDRTTGTTQLVSAGLDGSPGNGPSYSGSVSNNGRYVAFTSWATDLTAADPEPFARIHLADMQTGTVELVAEIDGGFGGDSFVPHLSGNGRYVAFETTAAIDPADTNQTWDIYLHDLNQDQTTWVTADAGTSFGSFQPRMSEAGRWIVFESYSDNLVDGDTNGVVDVFRWHRTSGAMERVSASTPDTNPDAGARAATISSDGSRVAFQTGSDGEIAGDNNGHTDTFVRDLDTDELWWISDPAITAGITAESRYPSISANGSTVAFESVDASLTDGDGNEYWDPFIVDLDAATVSSAGNPIGPLTPEEAFLFGASGAERFEDVPEGAYFDGGVGFLAANGVTTGVNPTNYGPEQMLTRGQMVTMLHRFNGRPDPGEPTPFVDVPERAYFADAVGWAHGEGVVKGVSETRFDPMAPVTRAQMATMLYRLLDVDLSLPDTPFVDVPDDVWYDQPVRWMYQTGITTGVSADRFDPNSTVTRGQAATFLERFARRSGWTPTWTGGWADE